MAHVPHRSPHSNNLKLKKNQPKQMLFKDLISNIRNWNQYFSSLTKAFIYAEIPSSKLNNKSLQISRRLCPKETLNHQILRDNYIEDIFVEKLNQIREVIADNCVYSIVDETTDSCRTYVLNVMVGALNAKYCKTMLLMTKLINKSGCSAVSQGVLDASVVAGSD